MGGGGGGGGRRLYNQSNNQKTVELSFTIGIKFMPVSNTFLVGSTFNAYIYIYIYIYPQLYKVSH